MRNITTTVYQYNELSNSAKEKAKEWFISGLYNMSDWYDGVYDDADTIAALMGIKIDRKRTGSMPNIMFSGFCSQGDGACFEGHYSYAKGAVKAVASHTGNDVELVRIAKALQDAQRKNFYRLTAKCTQNGNYYHANAMSVHVEDCENIYRDIGSVEDDVTEALRDFANWIYKQLENESEWLASDENVEESILANEYEFDEDGNRA